jgi:hypothetical protein
MRKNIKVLIEKFGSVDELKKEICSTLEEVTKDGMAEGAVNQIIYWSKMLLILKNEY